jgi:hypothetical protein
VTPPSSGWRTKSMALRLVPPIVKGTSPAGLIETRISRGFSVGATKGIVKCNLNVSVPPLVLRSPRAKARFASHRLGSWLCDLHLQHRPICSANGIARITLGPLLVNVDWRGFDPFCSTRPDKGQSVPVIGFLISRKADFRSSSEPCTDVRSSSDQWSL